MVTERVEFDLEFHKAILRASGNSLFLNVGDLIAVGLRHLFRSRLEATSEEDERWLRDHKAVADAINSGDA